MNRSQEIKSILSKRRPLEARISEIQKHLQSVQGMLGGFQQYMTEIRENTENGQHHNIQPLQEECTRIYGEFNNELARLNKLKTRFSRSTLNIGVIGRARQGKSRFLQALTGLGTEEIPSGDRTDCTGVRSLIKNHDGQVEGKVRFYRSTEFLDYIIGPYYEKLGLGVRPANLDAFSQSSIPPLPKEKKDSAVAKSHYEYLERYQKGLTEYRHLLGESPRNITRNDIRRFVAQSSSDASEQYYNFFAVQDVEIRCPFAASEVSGIALIDTPGLGDTGIGSEERLLKTLAEDVDLIIFIRRPNAGGDSWKDTDTSLYDTCANAISELPVGKWAFMVLNKTASESGLGNNTANCYDIAKQIQAKDSRFVQTLIADCSNFETLKNEVLDPALAFLESNIEKLDTLYISKKQEQLTSLRNRIFSFLSDADATQIFGAMTFSLNEEQSFLDSFENAWQETLFQFDKLMDELFTTRNSPNENFEKGIQSVVEEAKSDTGIPDIEKIRRVKSTEGSWTGAFDDLLQKVRANLSYKFLGLDDFLHTSTEGAKVQVSDIFKSYANFSGLTNKSGTDFFKDLKNLCDIQGYDFQLIQEAMSVLAGFRISFRGFLQHRVRKQLDNLTPDISEYKDWRQDITDAETLQKYLSVAHNDALEKIETALKEFVFEPNQAIFAIIEEFYDRAFRAEGVKNQWQVFFQINRAGIWPEQFQKISEGTALREKWSKYLRELKQGCEENHWSTKFDIKK